MHIEFTIKLEIGKSLKISYKIKDNLLTGCISSVL